MCRPCLCTANMHLGSGRTDVTGTPENCEEKERIETKCLFKVKPPRADDGLCLLLLQSKLPWTKMHPDGTHFIALKDVSSRHPPFFLFCFFSVLFRCRVAARGAPCCTCHWSGCRSAADKLVQTCRTAARACVRARACVCVRLLKKWVGGSQTAAASKPHFRVRMMTFAV